MATDAANLTKTCSFRITVNDTQAPTFTLCPGSQSMNTAPGSCASAAVTYATPDRDGQLCARPDGDAHRRPSQRFCFCARHDNCSVARH